MWGIGSFVKSVKKAIFRDVRGNVALSFAFAGVALIGVAGIAIDYSKVSGLKAGFQNAADSAALAAANALRQAEWGDSKQLGIKQFNSNLILQDGVELTSLTLENVDDSVVVKAKGKNTNSLMHILGIAKTDFNVMAVARFPDHPIEVAMVLDTTFSMSVAGKIEALKTTSHDFVDTLLDNANDNVKIAIVPFAQYVNVGRDKMGELWLNAQDQEVTVPSQCTTHQDIVSQTGCSTTSTYHPPYWVPESCSPASYNDGVLVSPASCTPGYMHEGYTSSSTQCENTVYGEPYETCTDPYTYTINWNGCVASRNYPLNLEDQTYSSQVPGPNNLICGSEITPLTDSKSTLDDAIDALNPVSDTYIPQGVAWGVRTLSSGAPYTEAMDDTTFAAKKGKRYLIVMTDGVNVRSPLVPASPLHTGTDKTKSDDWLLEACTNAKDEDITVFTISFGTTVDAATKALLQSCATNSAYYFDAETNENLAESFHSIASAIMTVYLSK